MNVPVPEEALVVGAGIAGLAAAHRLGRAAAGVIVFDGEQGPVRLGLAGALADAAGGRLLPLSALEAA